MAKEYIEREAALRAVADVQYMMYADEGHKAEYAAVDGVFHTLETVPVADVVEVVRCKDCKHCDPENGHCDHILGTSLPFSRKPDDYCSYGERWDAK